jgi:hypothetical protein
MIKNYKENVLERKTDIKLDIKQYEIGLERMENLINTFYKEMLAEKEQERKEFQESYDYGIAMVEQLIRLLNAEVRLEKEKTGKYNLNFLYSTRQNMLHALMEFGEKN